MDTLDKNELSRLITESLEGVLTSEQSGRLDHLLSQHPEAVEYYTRHLRIYSLITKYDVILFRQDEINEDDICQFEIWKELEEYEKIAPGVENPLKEPKLIEKVVYPTQEKLEVTRLQIFTWVMSAAAILFFMVFPMFVAPKPSDIEVATLVDEINVQWADSSVSVEKGGRLWTHRGPLRLNKGIVMFRYDDGVDVLVEGPAVFEIEQFGIFLDHGRTYCRVPNSGLGFTVRTPSSKFVDMGTEFGIQAGDQLTELHVVKGEVQLFAGSEKQSKLSQKVTTDSAFLYDANAHQLKSISFDKHRFVSQIDSKTKTVLRGYSNRYEAAVAATRPVAWYRFEKGQDALGYDEISDTASICEFSEPVTLAGGLAMDTESASQSLYLAGDAGSGIFLSDKAVQRSGGKALAISLWIRPEAGRTQTQNIICFTNHEKETNSLKTNQLYLMPDNRVVFYAYNLFNTTIAIPFKGWDESRSNAKAVWVEDDKSLSLNQWSHVAACFSDKKVDLYVNGQLCGTQPISVRTECHEGGYWGIGCKTGPFGENDINRAPVQGPLYSYKGHIDEICFYDRPLTAQEVQSIYEAAPLLP